MRIFSSALLILFSIVAHADNKFFYPERARMLRISGEINLLYDISPEGKPDNIRVVSVNPNYIFDRDVKKQIKTWHYPPNQPKRDVALRIIFKAS